MQLFLIASFLTNQKRIPMKKFSLLISSTIFFLLSFEVSLAGNYTWTGTTNTDWATGTNWSPTGAPSTNDTATVVTHTNLPLLAANTTIKKFTMTSGTLDCNGFTLTISAAASFNGGTINNGTLTCSGTSTLTFAGTTFGAVVSATGNNILFNGSVFNSTLTAVKKGSTSDNGTGGNVFAGAVTFIDSGSGNLVLGNNTAPDTFNAALTLSTASTGAIFMAHQSSGNYFSDVTCSTGGIIFNQYGSSSFTGNIVVNSSSRNVEFGTSTGTCTLASGKSISIGGSGFSAGTLTLRGFVQNGSSPSISLALTGTATLEILSGSVMNANLKASAPILVLSTAKFYGTDSLTHTGGNSGTSSGCYFGGSTYISNTSSPSNLTFTLGNTVADTFATTATINDVGLGTIAIKNGYFQGTTLFKNSITGTLTNRFTVATSGTVTIKAALTLDCVFSGMTFGSSGGTTILDTSATLSLTSGFAGELKMNNVEQHNTTAMSLSMTTNTASGNNTIFRPGTGCIFNGNFTYLGQRLQLNGATYNGITRFTRFNANDDASAGGNVFNGTTYITDSVINHIHNFTLAVTDADDYNGNVTFKQYGTSSHTTDVLILPAYTKNSTFGGNVSVDGTSQITFGSNGGRVVYDGGKRQTVSKTGSYNPSFKRIEINSHNGLVALEAPLTLVDTLFLTSGILATDATNLLIVPDNKIVSGGTDTAYVFGPVKKIGNDAFTFPLGDTSLSSGAYHPLSITAPSRDTAAYIAQYFATAQTLGSTKVDSMGYISNCEYWTLNRNADTCQVKPTLGWNTNSCYIDTALQRITYWNSTRWESLGKGTLTGTPTKGTLSSLGNINAFGTFTLAQLCNITADITSAKGGTICAGVTDTITATPAGQLSYQFFKNGSSVQTGSSDKYISSSLSNGDVIKVKVTNLGSCFSYDSLTMTVNSLPTITLSIDSATFCKGQTHTLTASGTGLTSYLWSTGATTASISVSTAETYTINASNGTCTGTNSRVIALYDTVQPTITVIGNTVICTGNTTADLQASLTGAVNFLWSTAETTSLITVEDSAIYQVTCFDAHHCYVHNWQVITQATPPAAPIITPTGTVHPCTPDSGETFTPVTLHVTNYDSDLLWTTSETTQDIDIAYEDIFIATYTDPVSGCYANSAAVTSIISTNSVAPDSITTNKPGNEVCRGDSITLTEYGGVLGGPLFEEETDSTYWGWYIGGCGDSLVGTGTLITVHPTVDTKYYLRAEGPCGTVCDSVIVYCMSIAMASTDVTCPGYNNGSVRAVVMGGTRPYSFEWSPKTGGLFSLWDLSAGYYRVTVADSLGCTLTDSSRINDPDSIHLSISTTLSSCHEASGTAKVIASGGAGNYYYNWIPGGEIQDSIGELAANIYRVIVSDGKGCAIDTSVNISDSDGPEVDIDSTENVTCNGYNDGYVAFSVGHGLDLDPIHIWEPCGIIPNQMVAGIFPFIIEDSMGCKTAINVTITEPTLITLSITSTPSLCGDSTGSAQVVATGGTGTYTYKWSSGGEDDEENFIPSGVDTIVVTDENECSSQQIITIVDTNSFTLAVSKIDLLCHDDSSGYAAISINGGHSPYQYVWSTGLLDSSSCSTLQSGFYTVIVIDSNGCKQKIEFAINSPEKLINKSIVVNPSSDSLSDGSITLEAKGGAPTYSYLWSPGNETASALTHLGMGQYSVTITDVNNCSSQASFIIGPGGNSTFTPSICDDVPGITYCTTVGNGPCGGIFPCTVDITDPYFHDSADGNDYECSFEKLSDYINRLCPTGSTNSITVEIPAGTYIVGRQDHQPAGGGYYLGGHNVICLQGCSNVTINGAVNGDGTPASKIIFRSCLRYGAFNPTTGDRFLNAAYLNSQCSICNGFGPFCFYQFAAFPGNCINIFDCNNIAVNNLELNGNIDKMSIGGYFSDASGIELAFSGIQAANSNVVSINNVNSHHFGSDGIVIEDTRTGPQQQMQIVINNSKFNYNCRNGMSWDGGAGVSVQNSDFNNNSLGSFQPNPGGGVDFEWEQGNQSVSNGNFSNCRFMYNRVFGVECNHGNTSLDALDFDFTFGGCTFVSSENGFSAWPNARKFNFTCCNFYGTIIHAYDAEVNDIPLNSTKFLNCTFNEEFNDGTHTYSHNPEDKSHDCTNAGHYVYWPDSHKYLVDFFNSYNTAKCGGVSFIRCQFHINFSLQFFEINGSTIHGGSLNDYHVQLRQCNFYNHGLCSTWTGDYNVALGYNIYMYSTYMYTPIYVQHGPGVYYTDGNGSGFPANVIAPLKIGANTGDNAWENFNGAWNLWGLPYQLSYSSCDGGKYLNPVPDFYWIIGSATQCTNVDEYCIDEACTIKKPCICAYPNDISCFAELKTSMSESNNSTDSIQSKIALYPNPVTDILTITNVEQGEEIWLQNMLGDILFVVTARSSSIQLNIQGLPTGIYYINATHHNIDKFVKF
jgi:hypothetical protein